MINWQVKVSNQITATFMNKNQKLDNKIEYKNPRFLVVAEINKKNLREKQFIIVPAKTKEELFKYNGQDVDLNKEILWKSVTAKYRKTDRWLHFPDYYILVQRNGKYFIKKQNEEQEVQLNIKHYKNNDYYDLNDQVFKEKLSEINITSNKADIFEEKSSSTNIPKKIKSDVVIKETDENTINKFKNEYNNIKDRKIFFNDMLFQDDTNERKSLELLQKQWVNSIDKDQQIKSVRFTKETREKLESISIKINSSNIKNIEIELEVEFQLLNKPLTYTFKLDSQKYEIVNCKKLTQDYYYDIKNKFDRLDWMIKIVEDYEKNINDKLNFFESNLERIKEVKKCLEVQTKNFSESYHRRNSYHISSLLSFIKKYNEYITNIKKESNLSKLSSNKDFLGCFTAFKEKYKSIEQDKSNNNYQNISHYKCFDNDFKTIASEFFKIIGVKKVNFRKNFDWHKDWDLISHSIDYSIEKIKKEEKIGFMEKIGSFFNKILIKLKLKKPSATMKNNKSKINEITKIIQSMTEEAQTTISQDSLNSANQEINYEKLLLQQEALSLDLNFWLNHNNSDWCKNIDMSKHSLDHSNQQSFKNDHFDKNKIIDCEQINNKETLENLGVVLKDNYKRYYSTPSR